jgi:predicted XRE-type DNA-binding protein
MNKTKKMTRESIVVGSGNVFRDLGLPNSDEALAKAKLAMEICSLIEKTGLTQAQAAKQLHIDQPKISALMRGRLAGFSVERLFRFLNELGQNVEIKIRPAHHSVGEVRVLAKSA